MRSLTVKLTLAFLFVGLLGAILVAYSVARSTQREFDQFVVERYLKSTSDGLADFYAANQSWQGVQTYFFEVRRRSGWPDRRGLPVVLLDANRRVVFSSEPQLDGYQPGQIVKLTRKERAVTVEVDGQTRGWIVFAPPPRPLDRETPEAAFLDRMSQAILFSALGATVVALLLGFFLARSLSRPIRELTVATQAMARGELDQQVSVRSHDELGELAASFNQMSTDLAQANHLRRQMTADIAHDLRTPLSVILGYTEALADNKLPGSPEVFEIMHDEAQHLSRLVEDLRTLSLADAGELPLHRQPIPPQALLERTAAAHKSRAEQQAVSLDVAAAPNLPEVNVDPERMAQVLGNLVNNALRYTPAEGQIRLTAETDPKGVTLAVTDSGSGIAPQDLPHIFERFYRADKSRPQNGESGLGLPIAKSLVAMHGGTITAESTPGQGTRFTIRLPRL